MLRQTLLNFESNAEFGGALGALRLFEPRHCIGHILAAMGSTGGSEVRTRQAKAIGVTSTLVANAIAEAGAASFRKYDS